MARTKKSAPVRTVTVDAVDQLVERLNTIGSIEFVRDAWENKAPDEYGVVELSGEVRQMWADGHLVDSVYRVIVSLYVKGDSDEWPALIQETLEDLEDEGRAEISHTNSRDFDYQTGKVRWTWSVGLYGPLTWEEEAPAEGDA
jgi:hypothetical protein